MDPDTQADLFDQAIAAGQTGKQDTLVSGTNIKTVNGNSLLGSGNLSISTSTAWGGITGTLSSQTDLNNAINAKQDTLVSGTNIKSVNGSSLLGSGNITVPQIIVKKTMVSHTGTSTSGNTMIASEDISAQISANTYYHISVVVRKTSGSSSSSAFRLYVNSSASLTGATLIGTMVSITSVNNIANNTFNFVTDSSNNMYVVAPSSALSNNYVTGAGTVITIPSPCYLLWASQTPNGDTIVLLNSTVTKYV
ncbi:MAG: hypothetical protein EBT86_13665 [Actinobacteria bacterium]|nr:hypothetical protein [Actinomycetota bacterium]